MVGILNFTEGMIIVDDSNILDNIGGGIGNSLDSHLKLTNSTVSGNTGDGINNFGGTLNITNSTISNNTFSSGGGISNFSNGVVALTNTTIASNTFNILGGGINNFSGTVTLKNTIVANNSTDDCRGNITSIGHNLDRDNTCNLTAIGDLADSNPRLGPLQNNGSDTKTHALLAGSPAIDAADNVTCPSFDQRGSKRPVDGDIDGMVICDIGSIEMGSTIYLPVILNAP